MSTLNAGVNPEVSAGRGGERAAMWALAVLCFAGLSSSVMQTMVIPIQGELGTYLNTSPANASWGITATLISGAIAMPVTGRLADLFGHKPVLVAAALILAAGSLTAALSNSLAPFIVGRTLQGVALGLIPVAISLAGKIAPPAKRGSAIALMSATLGIGGAMGMPLAAWIAQTFDWHAMFWFSTVLATVVTTAILLLVPSSPGVGVGRFDLVGTVGLAISLSMVLIGVSKGAQWGWLSTSTLICLLGGLGLLIVWARYELVCPHPLVDLRTSLSGAVLFTNLAALMIGFAMMAQSIVVPQLLQLPESTGYGLGQTMVQAGLWMAPAGLMMMLFAPVAAKMIDNLGPRITLTIAPAVVGLGFALALFMNDSAWQLAVVCCVANLGTGIGYAALPTLIMRNVPDNVVSSGVGVNALMRSLGIAISGAVMAAVLTANQGTAVAGASVPLNGAFQACFVIGVGAAVLAALLAWAIPPQAGGPIRAEARVTR